MPSQERRTAHPRNLGPVLAAAMVIAGCAAPAAQVSQGASGSLAAAPSASASSPTPTSASRTSGPSATPAPTLAFAAPADILPPLSLTTVVVDGLRIRERPRLSAPVVATAAKGELVYVNSYGGPVVADGVDWYPVGFAAGYRDWPASPTGAPTGSGTPGFVDGWAGAASGAQRYLELRAARCPEGSPDLGALTNMTEWDRLACFGDRPLQIEGTYGCGGCGGTTVGDFAPQWLAYPVGGFLLRVNVRSAFFLMHDAPDSGIDFPEPGSILRVTGHFNDPVSATCTMTRFDGEQGVPVDPRTAQLYCRERFVVDSFEVIGTDPDFPGP